MILIFSPVRLFGPVRSVRGVFGSDLWAEPITSPNPNRKSNRTLFIGAEYDRRVLKISQQQLCCFSPFKLLGQLLYYKVMKCSEPAHDENITNRPSGRWHRVTGSKPRAVFSCSLISWNPVSQKQVRVSETLIFGLNLS